MTASAATGILFTIFLFSKPANGKINSFRLGFNLMNAALAAFTAGLILTGIVDIAGTDSPYILYFYVFGFVLLIPSSLLVLVSFVK